MSLRPATYRLLDIVSLVVILLVMFIAGMFLYIRFAPIDVIDNKTWVLCTAPLQNNRCKTGKPTFQTGQTIPIYVHAHKLRSVGGTFTTSVECKNQAGVFVDYLISEVHSNRGKGTVNTEIDTKVPNRVPTLPTTCRIAYVIEYSIYSFRDFSEYNVSNEFTLIAQPPQLTGTTIINEFASASSLPSPPAPKAEQAMVPTPQSQATSPSSQSTSSSAQSSPPSSTIPTSNPSFLDRLLNKVTNLSHKL